MQVYASSRVLTRCATGRLIKGRFGEPGPPSNLSARHRRHVADPHRRRAAVMARAPATSSASTTARLSRWLKTTRDRRADGRATGPGVNRSIAEAVSRRASDICSKRLMLDRKGVPCAKSRSALRPSWGPRRALTGNSTGARSNSNTDHGVLSGGVCDVSHDRNRLPAATARWRTRGLAVTLATWSSSAIRCSTSPSRSRGGARAPAANRRLCVAALKESGADVVFKIGGMSMRGRALG